MIYSFQKQFFDVHESFQSWLFEAILYRVDNRI